MPRMLSDLVETAPGFRAAVNIVQEQDDLEKARLFLPTKSAAEVLFDVGRQVEPRGKERARIISGTYGTGKSHLALVLTSLYRGHREALDPLMKRMAEKYPGRAASFEREIAVVTPEKPFLVVVIEGDQDSFDAALVRGLRKALDRAGLREFMPKTYFAAAAERLQELLVDTDAKARLDKAARELGIGAPQDLLLTLQSESVEVKHLEWFKGLHERVCFGAPFAPEQQLEAASTYQEAARELVAAGRFRGIVVIWDEFGAFMEQILRDPGTQGLSVQRFAETCQNSGENQLHLYLVTHRSLEGYVKHARYATKHAPSRMLEDWEQDFKKVSGRFREFVMESEPEELFTLIDDVLIQRRGDGWDEFARERESDFSILTDCSFRAELFPDLSSTKLRTIVVEGCYPLSPTTTALLPRVAKAVAQNQRTLFTFLCGDHPGSIAHYLRQTPLPQAGAPLPLVACDALWDYFESAIREDSYGQQVYRHYRHALATASPQAKDLLGQRLLKVLALFELVGGSDRQGSPVALAKEDMFELALDLRSEEQRQALRERLKELSAPGSNRVAVRGRDGVYRLVPGSGTELADAVNQALEQRSSSFSPAQFLRNRWGKAGRSQPEFLLGFECTIEAFLQRSDVVSRTVEVVVLLPEETDNLGTWTKDLGGGDYKDGLLFLVIADEDVHLGAISKRALEYADKPQIIFARPAKAIRGIREVVARINALEAVAQEAAGLWGKEGERRDEWVVEYEQAVEQLQELLAPVGLRQGGRDLNLECVWRGSPRTCRSWADLLALTEEAMGAAFSSTPKTKDEMMKSSPGRDGLAGARRAVLDTLLEHKGPELLVKQKDQAQQRHARLLESVGMLKRRPRADIGRPDPEHDAGSAAVWDYLQGFLARLKEAPREVSEVERALRSAPYGIGRRVLPLLFAAALREDLRAGNIVLERLGRGQEWQSQGIDGASLDEAFMNPQGYRFRYEEVTRQQFSAVEGLIDAVAGESAVPASRAQLLEEAKRQVALWWSRLPSYCQQTANLSQLARRFRDETLRPLVHPSADAHRILVEELWQKMGDTTGMDRAAFRTVFAELIREIAGAADELLNRIAGELREGLHLDVDGTPEDVVRALREWYNGLPEATRTFCHAGDAGKLQGWLRCEVVPELGQLCTAVMGRDASEWSDSDVGYFVGRVQSAKEAVETWQPLLPPPPTPDVEQLPGMATLSLSADYAGRRRQLTRQFATIDPEALSEDAKMLMRFLRMNLVEARALRDGERENLVTELIWAVFGDG